MKCFPVIAVPGGDMQRAAQISKNTRRLGIFCRRPVVGQVTRVNDKVRWRIETIYVPHATFKIPDPGLSILVLRIDMCVGNLYYYHHSRLDESVIDYTLARLGWVTGWVPAVTRQMA